MIFKDDDVGKDTEKLKKWVELITSNDAKGSIGLIGKYIKDSKIRNFLETIDEKKIEIFCHGYYHGYLPFIERKKLGGRNIFFHVEFDKSRTASENSLKKYRSLESRYLKKKAITFGPPGNIWNEYAIESLEENGFKLMFSWKKINSSKIFTIPLSDNLNKNSFEEFKKSYEQNKNDLIYTLQFHHAKLSDAQFDLIPKVIDFLKKDEKRIFIRPSELMEIPRKDEEILNLISDKDQSSM